MAASKAHPLQGTRPDYSRLCGVACLLFGAALLSAANGTSHPFILAGIFLAGGVSANFLLGQGRGHEQRAFILTFGACALIAGLAQCYSEATFGELTSAIDARWFHEIVRDTPRNVPIEELSKTVQAALAVRVWQYVYLACSVAGLDGGPWIGVLFNSLLVGLSAGTTVRIARDLFGDDVRRLRRVGALFATCGMFWLFGSLFLRDSFVLFCQTWVLWALVRMLKRPHLRSVLFAIVITGLASACMWYLRRKAVPLFALFGLVCLVCWYFRARVTLARISVVACCLLALVLLRSEVKALVATALDFASERSASQVEKSRQQARPGSLGLSLVIDRPLPIRLPAGSLVLLIRPIPIWAFVKPGASEYHLIKTYHATYSVVVVPAALVGFMVVVVRTFRDKQGVKPALFVGLYAVIGLLVVVGTSMETRHWGQFLPAIVLLAAVPDMSETSMRTLPRKTRLLWIVGILLMHVAWMVLRYAHE